MAFFGFVKLEALLLLILLNGIRRGKVMFKELFKAFFFIFMAEMGDKTQILAMTFATRYRVSEVLIGVLIGSALNHGLAIALGVYLSNIIPVNTIQLIAAVSFILFGLWTLKSDEEEEEESKKNLGPILTVATSFFIGELGDKTQLTAITLSTDAAYPLFILMGTVSGMLATSEIGIFLGSKLGERIPEYAIKFLSAAVFMFFGILKLFENLPSSYLTPLNIAIFFIILAITSYLFAKPIVQSIKERKTTPLKQVASSLYINTHRLKACINDVCPGKEVCGDCDRNKCLIGYTKDLLENAEKTGDYRVPQDKLLLPEHRIKNFNRDKIRAAIIAAVEGCLNCGEKHNKSCIINKSREALERIYFGETLTFNGDIDDYIEEVRKRERRLAERLEKIRGAKQKE